MSSKSPDIVIDLNRMTRAEFEDLMLGREGRLSPEENAALVCKVVESWPYDQPVTVDGFRALGLEDSLKVERFVVNAIQAVTEKN